MKIGIITFHRADNVGAVLQSWALQQYLIRLGHQAYIVDYRCKAIESDYDVWNPRILWSKKNIFRSLHQYVNRIKYCKLRKEKKALFERFRFLHLKLTCPVRTIESIPKLDVYITGSDQVWNTASTRGVDPFYFLDFPAITKISYAASTEKKAFYQVPDKYKDKMKNALKKIDALSVRETWLRNELETFLSPKDVYVCVDPVFLLPKELYDKISICPQGKPYVFVYQVVESEMCSIIANSLANKYNLEVVYMHASQSTCEGRHLYCYGPSEFLGYISNAQYIITTSFHGMAFSLIFQKEFWVVDTGMSNRQKNLLNMLGLTNRIITSENDSFESTIDYEIVSSKFQKFIDDSKAFLKSSIK